MARYVIRVWDTQHIVKEREVIRYTLPRAWQEFKTAVYDVLEAFGKLDTIAAYNAMARADEIEDMLQIGEERGFEVSNTGKSVKIMRVHHEPCA